MKRVLPLVILSILIQLATLIWFSCFISDKQTYKLSENATLEYNANSSTLKIYGMGIWINTFEDVSPQTYQCIVKKKQFTCRRFERYNSLFFLTVLAWIAFVVFLPLKLVDLSESYYSRFEPGLRFDDGLLSKARHDLYNYIDGYDFTPWKEWFKTFFGY